MVEGYVNLTKENSKESTVAIIGLGYVGLPLALLFVEKGFHVIGIDIDSRKLEMLRKGKSYISDITDPQIVFALTDEKLKVTSDYRACKYAEAIIICVPTPLDLQHKPELYYLLQAGNEISQVIKKGQLVVLESSTYPGTTREALQPILEKSNLKVGRDIFLGYSPERIDPGNKEFPVAQIPKVISGVTQRCAQRVELLYSRVFQSVVTVSSTEAAELTKLLENTYRFVNISLINEMAILCDAMNINVWEVIAAAKTKPFGFSAFYPGPGIGGHCIPVDPLYLSWKLEGYGLKSKFIDIATHVNNAMPEYIASRLKLLLGPSWMNARVLLYGLAYKKDIDDVRESSAYELLKLLKDHGSNVSYHDPYVTSVWVDHKQMNSVFLTDEIIRSFDCVVILTDHTEIPLSQIMEHAAMIYDTRNITQVIHGKAKVYRLGGG